MKTDEFLKDDKIHIYNFLNNCNVQRIGKRILKKLNENDKIMNIFLILQSTPISF